MMIQARFADSSIRTFVTSGRKTLKLMADAPSREEQMKWSLKTIAMASLRLDPSLIRRRDFVERLEERSKQLRRGIELYDQVIWPVIIRGEDSMLKDGYCRSTTLKAMGVKRTLAYVGD